LFLEVFPKQH